MAGTTLPLAQDEFSGRVLGKYEVLCRLSMGGMSEIFLAHQRGLAGFRKPVVLKQILPDIRGEEEFVRMFLDEARVTAAFSHPNIAQVYDLDIADDELFLVMEFVQGATLVELARACRAANEPIPIGFTLAAVRDTALALHYAHVFVNPGGKPQPVIHRDVAEKNIMVTYEGVTKLLDFGIAKTQGVLSRTNVGMVKGTSGYMSPEQILGNPLDARSDLFSLGVVLHECLTGMRLFYGKSAEAGMMAALKEAVAPPSKTNKGVPPEVDAVTLKALARNRDERYGSCLEFARALERAAGPLMWHPEQSGELMDRLFAERREQTRELMEQAVQARNEGTGEIQLQKLLGRSGPPAAAKTPAPVPPPLPPPLPKIPASEEVTGDISPEGVAHALEVEDVTGVVSPSLITRAVSEAQAEPAAPAKPSSPAPSEKKLPRRSTSSELQARMTPEPLPRRTSTALPARPAASNESSGEVHTQKMGAVEARAARRPSVSESPPPRTPRRTRSLETPAKKLELPWEQDETTGGLSRDEDGEETRVEAPRASRPGEQPETTDVSRTPVLPPARAEDEATEPTPPQSTRKNRGSFQTAPPEETTHILSRRGGGVRKRPGQSMSEALAEELEDEAEITTPGVESTPPPSRKPWLAVLGFMTVALAALVYFGMRSNFDPMSLLKTSEPMVTTEAPPPAMVEEAPEAAQPVAPVNPPKVETEKIAPKPTVEAAAEKKDRAPIVVPPEPSLQVDPKESDAPKPVVTTPKKSSKTVAASTRAGSGLLTLVAQPYAEVSFNGRSIGTTPLFKVSLPAGRHTLKLKGEDGQARSLEVEITDGETSTHRVQLEKLPAN